MSAKKARADAVLKTAPENVQAEVICYLRGHSLRDTGIWCAEEHGLDVSTRMLSEFRDWYETTGMLSEIKRISDQFKADLKRMPNVDLGDDTIGRIGQSFFETMALKDRNPKLHIGLRKLRLKGEEYDLARDRFEFGAAGAVLKHAEAVRAISDGGASNDEKISKLRELMFGDLEDDG